MPSINRAAYERALIEVDRILYENWDPIGVNEEPAAIDEYRGYVPGVIRLLFQGTSEREVCAHLLHIEVTRMEITCSPQQRSLVARKLLAVPVDDIFE